MTTLSISTKKNAAIKAVPSRKVPRNCDLVREENVERSASGCPSPAQQEALIIKYRLKARKLGRSILRRWHARLDLEEVDSIVDLSLCEAVKRFDATKGASFMTFLFYHLKGNLVRAVATAANAHTIPLFTVDAAEVERAEREHFTGFQHRGLNASEVAEALCSQEVPMPDEALWRKELTGKSADACQKLDALEKEIIKRIFIQEQQIMDIAATLGYSRCHISRVKKKALETLHGELSADLDLVASNRAVESDDAGDSSFGPERLECRRVVHRRRPRSQATRRQAIAYEVREAA